MGVMEQFRLTGKTALVTGGTRGLGREMAAALAEAGASVLVVSRNQADADRVAVELAREFNAPCLGSAGDVADPAAASRWVALAKEKLGGLHIVINNAGVNVRGAIDAVTLDDYRTVLDTNLTGPWMLCRAALPIMKEQRYGRIVNIASTLGMVGMADRSLYCASKGGLVQLTRALAMEFAPFNITVNAICPGPFETEMNLVLTQDPEKYKKFAAFAALNRWGRMGEIGPAALFLCSDASSYVTGAVLPVDGGWTTY